MESYINVMESRLEEQDCSRYIYIFLFTDVSLYFGYFDFHTITITTMTTRQRYGSPGIFIFHVDISNLFFPQHLILN